MTSADNLEHHSRGRSRAASFYMVTTALSVVGTALGLLGATAATTAAGGAAHGAFYTGVYMTVTFIGSALVAPYAPHICAHLSVRGAYAWIQAINAATYLVAGLALLGGASTMPTLLVAAPIFGATSGVSLVLLPPLSKAYLTSADTARAYARVSVATGIAWFVAGIVGGQLLSHIPFGWGLVLKAPLTVGLALTAACIRPASEPEVPWVPERPWRDAGKALRDSRVLRWTAAVGALVMVFLAPTASLVVPIAQDLRRSPEVAGAGLLMAAFAVGEIATPRVVQRLASRWAILPASAFAVAFGGGSLVALGVVSLLLSHGIELVAWLVIGIAFGAFRFAARSLTGGSAADSGRPEDAAANLAASTTVGLLVAPVGTLTCSIGIDLLSADAAVLLGGVGAIVGSALLLRALRSRPQTSRPSHR